MSKNKSIPFNKKTTPFQKLKNFLIILGIATSDFFNSIIFKFFDSSKVNSYEIIFKALNLFFAIFLCIYMLNYQLYKHHYLGIAIFLIGLIWYTLVDLLYEKNVQTADSTKDNITLPVWIIVIIMIITQFLGSLVDCTEKYLMDKKYLSPFFVISIEGLCGFVLVSILIAILSSITCQISTLICNTNNDIFIDNLSQIFQNLTPKIIGIVIFNIIAVFLFNIFRMKTNQQFSPLHRNLSHTFNTFIIWIIKAFIMVKDNEHISASKKVLIIFSNLFKIIGILIFLEIIILNFLGLARNTTEQINIREYDDYKELIESIDSILIEEEKSN